MDFKNKLILAPMAGVCDQPFRLLCKEQGCDILYSEMVSAKAIYYNNKNTKPLLAMDEKDALYIGQIAIRHKKFEREFLALVDLVLGKSHVIHFRAFQSHTGVFLLIMMQK